MFTILLRYFPMFPGYVTGWKCAVVRRGFQPPNKHFRPLRSSNQLSNCCPRWRAPPPSSDAFPHTPNDGPVRRRLDHHLEGSRCGSFPPAKSVRHAAPPSARRGFRDTDSAGGSRVLTLILAIAAITVDSTKMWLGKFPLSSELLEMESFMSFHCLR